MTTFQGINRITSEYGYRTYWNRGKLVKDELHRGIDLVPTAFAGQALPESAWQVREVTGGKVLRVTSDASRGKYVDIQTEPGTFERYQHMKSICVRVGQTVPQGTVLGIAGNTGNSTGAHLHFGVYRGGKNEGNAIDPSPWLGLPNKAGTYAGNDAVDGAIAPVSPTAPAKPQLYDVTVHAVSAGDRAAVEALAKQQGATSSVKAV